MTEQISVEEVVRKLQEKIRELESRVEDLETPFEMERDLMAYDEAMARYGREIDC
jgi:uncharacterized protein YlxW (UPF0749 family)